MDLLEYIRITGSWLMVSHFERTGCKSMCPEVSYIHRVPLLDVHQMTSSSSGALYQLGVLAPPCYRIEPTQTHVTPQMVKSDPRS